jgi:hypothetical protein
MFCDFGGDPARCINQADRVETPLFGGDGSAEGVSGLAILVCERFINAVMLDNTLAQSKSGARV